MIFIAILTVILFLFSPFLGILYGITYGCGFVLKNPEKTKAFFIVLSILIGVIFVLDISNILMFLNVVVGVLISLFIFRYVFQNTKNIVIAILMVGMTNFLYAVLRHFMFYESYREYINLGLKENVSLLEKYFGNNPEYVENGRTLLENMSNILVDYSISLWTASIILGISLGSLILAKRLKIKLEIKIIQLPFYLVYGLIFGLSLFIIPPTRVFGANVILSISSLFLIQGISIVLFFWWDYLKRSKVLMWMTILAVLMNPYIAILITLIGVADVWFDLRKLNRSEEKNENNPND